MEAMSEMIAVRRLMNISAKPNVSHPPPMDGGGMKAKST
jgi:hypothetical protein